jgi:glucose 1-dehydrogenase
MRVLVTGCSPGIGGATCLVLAERAQAAGDTAQIAACEIGPTAELETLVAALEGLGTEVVTPTGDLADPEVPARLVAEAVAAFGGLDGVVANAGITSPAPLAELELADWDRLFDVNVRAAWLLAKAAYPQLKESRGGFVGIGSTSGMNPHPGMGAYSPSKAAIIMLCRVLAQEWGPVGARANAVSPGMIRTPLTAAVYEDNATAQARADLVPQRRVGEPIDIANAVAWLVGPDNTYLNGKDICVDGGYDDSIMAHIPGRPTRDI